MHEWAELAEHLLYLLFGGAVTVAGWYVFRYAGRLDLLRQENETRRDAELKKHADEIAQLRDINTRLGNRVCHCEWLLKIEPPVE